MKKHLRLLGIFLAFLAVLSLSLVGCDGSGSNPDDSNNGDSGTPGGNGGGNGPISLQLTSDESKPINEKNYILYISVIDSHNPGETDVLNFHFTKSSDEIDGWGCGYIGVPYSEPQNGNGLEFSPPDGTGAATSFIFGPVTVATMRTLVATVSWAADYPQIVIGQFVNGCTGLSKVELVKN